MDFPHADNELHHFGWNAYSSHVCPYAPHAHVERRSLVVPGTHSSRIHVVDTHPDPRQPRLIKVIEGEEVMRKTGYAFPHTVHCGPDGIFMNALGAPDGDGPGGIFTLDHETFEVQGAWEKARGPQYLSYDHNPKRAYGFVGVVVSTADLSASVFLWYLDREAGEGKGVWKARKVITIPAEPADADSLPPILKGFGAVPPLVTDINLSVDDRWLYVSCWGTGELRRYDVSDPFKPVFTGSVRIGGIVGRNAHPRDPERPLNGGPQMVEVSRDGKRVYLTNSLYSPWDAQVYPDGIRGWMARLDARDDGSLALDRDFLVEFDDSIRPHQVRLAGGDACSDSSCFS